MMHPVITMMYGSERRKQMFAAAERQRLAREASTDARTARRAHHDARSWRAPRLAKVLLRRVW